MRQKIVNPSLPNEEIINVIISTKDNFEKY